MEQFLTHHPDPVSGERPGREDNRAEVRANADTDQRWTLTADGYLQNDLSGKCLDVDGDPGSTRSNIKLWDCETSGQGPSGRPTDQRWTLL